MTMSVFAVAVEVGHCDRIRPRFFRAEGLPGLKRPVAIAEQHARGGAVPPDPQFAVTRSLTPSPLKSATATEYGPLPVPKDCRA